MSLGVMGARDKHLTNNLLPSMEILLINQLLSNLFILLTDGQTIMMRVGVYMLISHLNVLMSREVFLA